MKYIIGAVIGLAITSAGVASAASIAQPLINAAFVTSISTPVTSAKSDSVYKIVDGKVTCYAYTAGGISCVK